MTAEFYEIDRLCWSEEQAQRLRAGRLGELEIVRLLEELGDIGREQKVALQSVLRQILIHLRKLELSPATASRGKGVEELVKFRAQAQTPLEEAPSLKHNADDLLDRAWHQAHR